MDNLLNSEQRSRQMAGVGVMLRVLDACSSLVSSQLECPAPLQEGTLYLLRMG